MSGATSFAQSKPSYAQARAFYDEMDKTVMQTGVWHQRTPEQRMQAKRASVALSKRADTLFGVDGPGKQCAMAATWHNDYVGNLNRIVGIMQGDSTTAQQLLAMQRTAADLGQTRAWCREYIETLDSKK